VRWARFMWPLQLLWLAAGLALLLIAHAIGGVRSRSGGVWGGVAFALKKSSGSAPPPVGFCTVHRLGNWPRRGWGDLPSVTDHGRTRGWRFSVARANGPTSGVSPPVVAWNDGERGEHRRSIERGSTDPARPSVARSSLGLGGGAAWGAWARPANVVDPPNMDHPTDPPPGPRPATANPYPIPSEPGFLQTRSAPVCHVTLRAVDVARPFAGAAPRASRLRKRRGRALHLGWPFPTTRLAAGRSPGVDLGPPHRGARRSVPGESRRCRTRTSLATTPPSAWPGRGDPQDDPPPQAPPRSGVPRGDRRLGPHAVRQGAATRRSGR
jgi:hypothetical protein